jgi:hypothetical protein
VIVAARCGSRDIVALFASCGGIAATCKPTNKPRFAAQWAMPFFIFY